MSKDLGGGETVTLPVPVLTPEDTKCEAERSKWGRRENERIPAAIAAIKFNEGVQRGRPRWAKKLLGDADT